MSILHLDRDVVIIILKTLIVSCAKTEIAQISNPKAQRKLRHVQVVQSSDSPLKKGRSKPYRDTNHKQDEPIDHGVSEEQSEIKIPRTLASATTPPKTPHSCGLGIYNLIVNSGFVLPDETTHRSIQHFLQISSTSSPLSEQSQYQERQKEKPMRSWQSHDVVAKRPSSGQSPDDIRSKPGLSRRSRDDVQASLGSCIPTFATNRLLNVVYSISLDLRQISKEFRKIIDENISIIISFIYNIISLNMDPEKLTYIYELAQTINNNPGNFYSSLRKFLFPVNKRLLF
jgi:hypothetical protein